MNKLLAIIFLVTACGKTKPKEPHLTDIERLKAKAEFYVAHAQLDSYGWIEGCDGLLFNSLYSLGGGHADPLLARGSIPGIWYRSADHGCYPGNSASSISRDMFAGLYLWIYHHKRLDLIEDIIDYGEQHANDIGGWVMGEGDKYATNIRIEGQAMAYLMRYKFGGADHGKRKFPISRFQVKGYEDHLQMLSILLRSLIAGGITDLDLAAAKDSSQRVPRNALYSAIYHRYSDGDQTEAIKILLDESLFPSDRMPSSADRCEMYLWQREDDEDWQPCSGGKVLSGVDFLFAKAVIFNEV